MLRNGIHGGSKAWSFVVPLCVVSLFIVVRLCTFLLVQGTDLIGDQGWYFSMSSRMCDELLPYLLSLDSVDYKSLVGRGLFMPGMLFLLSPLTCFGVEVDTARAAISALSCVIAIVIYLQAYRYHRAAATAMFLVLCAWPQYHYYSFTLWADALAGHLIVLFGLAIIRAHYSIATSTSTKPKSGLLRNVLYIGFLGAVCIYLRGNAALSIVAILIIWFLAIISVGCSWSRDQGFRILGCVLLFIALSLAPWRAATERILGAPYTLTTTLKSSLMIQYGKRDLIYQYTGKDETYELPEVWKKIRAQHTRYLILQVLEDFHSGIPFKQAEDKAWRAVMEPVSTDRILDSLTKAHSNHFFHWKNFTQWIVNIEKYPLDSVLMKSLRTLNSIVYLGLLMTTFIVFLVPVIGPFRQQIPILMWKAAWFAASTQPLVHAGNGRHWHGSAILMGLSLVIAPMLIDAYRNRSSFRRDSSSAVELGVTYLSVTAQTIIGLGAASLYLYLWRYNQFALP